MPTEMCSGLGASLQEKVHCKSEEVSTFEWLLLTCAHERISVFTCATDYYPLCALWPASETGYYFLMPNRSITAR
jgi:hypothetical protein